MAGGGASMSAPLVSIMVPVRNRRALLADCLKSALAQTCRDLEVVVVDNASTDGTWGVCREFARADSRVRIFRNPENVGLVHNWQRCFREAEGRFGKLLFSDDVLSSYYLEKTAPLLGDTHVAFVFTMAMIGPEPRASRLAHRFEDRTGRFSRQHYIRRALFGSRAPMSPGAALFRIKDLRMSLRLNIPSPTIDDFERHGAGIDLLLYLMTAARYEEVAYVAEPLVFFRAHEGSTSQAARDSLLADSYHQARIWFAAHTQGRWMLASTLAAAWLNAMKRQRRPVNPGCIADQFLPEVLESWNQ